MQNRRSKCVGKYIEKIGGNALNPPEKRSISMFLAPEACAKQAPGGQES